MDDSIDVTLAYQLLTIAKNDIETKLKLAILRASDSSQTTSPGDTYLTLKSLPTDFKSMRKLVVGTIPYYPVPFDKRIGFRNTARRYYIDYKRMVQGSTCLGLCGSAGSSQSINVFYQVATDPLTETNEDTLGVILWPDEFQHLIAYHVAKIKTGAIDADLETIKFNLSAQQEAEYQNLMDGLIAWDHDIKLAEMGNALGYADEEDEAPFDVGLL